METLISDLTMILVVAGATCLIFKKLKQPLVLGYIVAGFLTSPNFSYFPTIANKDNVTLWAEIGVIFLMFALGLEFSFYKLKKVGSSAFIATAVSVCGMVVVGYSAGKLLGWSHMNSLFLGGMLSMSSTAIIFKAFEDLGLKEEKFANFVLGVLIIEDIAGIVMMVLLSTIATASAGVSTAEIFQGIAKLIFCLVLWFVLGMYLVPSFFKRFGKLFNDETYLIVSLGLCLAMVEVAEHAGFSAALGAFIMGSLIAEAPESERIEHLVAPVKNLFSAIFFVSVGMLVNPTLLWQYIVPVIILILVTIIGQITCGTLGMLATGQSLKNAMRSGFCLCQIGEFSFILATMGSELGVTSNFLYPIVVAVSVITTFTTPFCMGFAEPAYELVQKLLPQKLLNKLPQEDQPPAKQDEGLWQAMLKDYALYMLIIGVLLLATVMMAEYYILPYLQNQLQLPYANYLTAALTLCIMSPLLAMLMQNHGELFQTLWYKNRFNHLPLTALIAGKMYVVFLALSFIFYSLLNWHGILAAAAIMLALYGLAKTPWLMSQYLRLESHFLLNLNEKHIHEHKGDEQAQPGLDTQLFIASYHVLDNSSLIGVPLKKLFFRQLYGCDIIRITTDGSSIFMPGGNDIITAGSHLTIIGKEPQLKGFTNAISQNKLQLKTRYDTQSLREYMLNEAIPEEYQLYVSAFPVASSKELLGKPIRDTQLRDKWNTMVVGLDRAEYSLPTPDVNLILESKDLLWLLGSPKDIQKLLTELPGA